MTPTIIKGTIAQIDKGGEAKPLLLIDDPNYTAPIVVPITNWLLNNLPPIKIGDKVIVTAICDADHRIMDAMTLLYDHPQQP